MSLKRKREPKPPTLGLTSANIAITLILNGVEPDEAKRVALEFGARYGKAALGTLEDEIFAWAKEHRP